jgi:hypothetical protein
MLIEQDLFDGHLLYSCTKLFRMLLFHCTCTVYEIVYHVANSALLNPKASKNEIFYIFEPFLSNSYGVVLVLANPMCQVAITPI